MNGSTWTETTDLNTARAVPGAGGGTAPGSSVLVAGGATSVAQDVAAMPLGSKGID